MRNYPKSIALIAGLASATGFAPLNLWPVTLAMLALLMALIAAAPGLRAAMARGYWFGVGHFTLGLNWIAHAFTFQDKMPWQLGYGAVAALALYLAVYPAVAAGLAWRWGGDRRSAPFLLVLAAGWIVTEWLRASLFTGFAWNPLAAVWLPLLPIARIAAWTGTYGLSGLTLIVAGGLWLLARRRWRAGAACILPVLLLGALHLSAAPLVDPARPLIRVVQPNIGQREKQDPAHERENFQRLAALSGRPGPVPRLLLWPEAAVPDYLEEDGFARWRLAGLLGPRDMLLTGGVALIGDAQGRVIGARNSLFALAPDGSLPARYDKAHLVPYGEYLPMRPILSAIGLSRLVPGDLDFWPGPGPRTIAIPGFGTVGVQICYEIIFSGAVIDPAHRPDFLFNPSNDAWFGAWGPPQHLAQARLRAIEEGIPVVRSTPTGISAVIDAQGRLLDSLPHESAGAIEARLPAAAAPTPFARLGNLLPGLLIVFLGALAVVFRRAAR
ncbi:MAG: apolipoprotein N-acyltransferase [Sphingomonas sp. SCN 67-18]|uniref:apolipoprotein N-acyltransferase n=1 Tax=uncultured Sphingomonas sp. TaxID=158754 RepID=UPI00086854C1|nr:apolipoprotein N-acyltransferase [Sphingomonas sp. SCN 67-18]ODU20979.1 MAG: apolipoprotein N-acyltransferase [Sphingomonas sp. SCN 67-18]